MAGNFTAYLDNKVVDHVFGAGTLAKPTLYLALTVGGTEVSNTGGTNYIRKVVTFDITAGAASLHADTDFPVAGTNWGTIDGAAIWDAVSGGNMLASGTLAVTKTINTGDIFRAPANSVTVTVA